MIRSFTSRLGVGLLSLLLSACAVSEKAPRLDPFAAVNPFQKFDPLVPPSPLAAQTVAQWETEFAKPGFLNDSRWHTRAGRDQLVYQLILMADYRFNRYQADLVAGKATRDTFVDLAVLGLNAAGVFLNPGQATRVLAAISGGLISSRAAVERNFYQNQAQSVLLRRMKVLRAQKLYSISHHLLKDGVDRYPIERALIDLLDYYNRGTMLGALDAIAQDTAAQEIEVQGGQVTRAPRVEPAPGTSLPLPTTLLPPTPEPLPPVSDSKSLPVQPPIPEPVSPPAPSPTRDPLHDRKAALIRQVRGMTPELALTMVNTFVPTNFMQTSTPKRRLQKYIEQTTDETEIARMEASFPH
jgi:hypothetical protein